MTAEITLVATHGMPRLTLLPEGGRSARRPSLAAACRRPRRQRARSRARRAPPPNLIAKRITGNKGSDRTKYGTHPLAPKSFVPHHMQRLSVAAVKGDAKGVSAAT